jgi:hypothetical protein
MRSPDSIVTFRGMDPSEVVVWFVHRCAARLPGETASVHATVEPKDGRYQVRLHVSQAGHACDVAEIDADALIAVRNAFARCVDVEHVPTA